MWNCYWFRSVFFQRNHMPRPFIRAKPLKLVLRLEWDFSWTIPYMNKSTGFNWQSVWPSLIHIKNDGKYQGHTLGDASNQYDKTWHSKIVMNWELFWDHFANEALHCCRRPERFPTVDPFQWALALWSFTIGNWKTDENWSCSKLEVVAVGFATRKELLC